MASSELEVRQMIDRATRNVPFARFAARRRRSQNKRHEWDKRQLRRRDDLAICRSDSKLQQRFDWIPIQLGPRSGESNVFGGQASKGIRWMPWLQEAMKDVVKLRKATVSRIQASTRRSPNRETGMESCPCGPWLNT